MNKMDVLDRLVSIKSNANGRAADKYQDNSPGDVYKIKAINLESGINQLIMEIQNSILIEDQTTAIINANDYKVKSKKPSVLCFKALNRKSL